MSTTKTIIITKMMHFRTVTVDTSVFTTTTRSTFPSLIHTTAATIFTIRTFITDMIRTTRVPVSILAFRSEVQTGISPTTMAIMALITMVTITMVTIAMRITMVTDTVTLPIITTIIPIDG